MQPIGARRRSSWLKQKQWREIVAMLTDESGVGSGVGIGSESRITAPGAGSIPLVSAVSMIGGHIIHDLIMLDTGSGRVAPRL